MGNVWPIWTMVLNQRYGKCLLMTDLLVVSNHWTGLLDWTDGLDYWISRDLQM